MFGQKFLLLLFEPFFKFILNFLFLILKLFLEIKEAFINIFHLLKFEPFKLFLDLLKEFAILIVQSLSIQYHFLEIKDILFQTRCHLFYLNELVAVMLIEYAPDTNSHCAQLAEVLNWLIVVSWTINVVFGVSDSATSAANVAVSD